MNDELKRRAEGWLSVFSGKGFETSEFLIRDFLAELERAEPNPEPVAMTYQQAEKIALRAIYDDDGRGMIGRGRDHLHQRVARAILHNANPPAIPEGYAISKSFIQRYRDSGGWDTDLLNALEHDIDAAMLAAAKDKQP